MNNSRPTKGSKLLVGVRAALFSEALLLATPVLLFQQQRQQKFSSFPYHRRLLGEDDWDLQATLNHNSPMFQSADFKGLGPTSFFPNPRTWPRLSGVSDELLFKSRRSARETRMGDVVGGGVMGASGEGDRQYGVSAVTLGEDCVWCGEVGLPSSSSSSSNSFSSSLITLSTNERLGLSP
jgi:hypothetical protein